MINTKKKYTIGFLIHFYRPNKNACRTDLTNDNQKAYAFAPKYIDMVPLIFNVI